MSLALCKYSIEYDCFEYARNFLKHGYFRLYRPDDHDIFYHGEIDLNDGRPCNRGVFS
jgi:hypothetical protein